MISPYKYSVEIVKTTQIGQTFSMTGIRTFSVITVWITFLLSPALSGVKGTEANSFQDKCVFPKFFQTPCKNSHQVCYWSQGKHYSTKERNGEKSKLHDIYSDWRWVVNGSNIFISTGLDKQDEGTSKSLTCTKQVDNQMFMFSVVHSLDPIVIKHSCLELVQRGQNVIEIKMANLSGNSSKDLCKDDMVSDQGLLIASTFKEVADCPAELLGGFDIMRVYDSKQRRYCAMSDNKHGIFETDCMEKEGIYIDLPGTKNCSFGNFLGHFENKQLHCYSREWKDGDFSYFITKRRYRSSYDVRREPRESELQCLKYKRDKETGEITVYLYKDPICNGGNGNSGQEDMYIIYLRKSNTLYHNPKIIKSKCTFPKELQGSWLERSHHFGDKSFKVSSRNIEIPQTGKFICKQMFDGISYQRCLADNSGAWPQPSRLQYFAHEYMLVSAKLNNGCRERMTRLSMNPWTDNSLVYRLSQSQPIRRVDGVPPDKFYSRLLVYFCAYKFLFSPDPYPYWGRNIEKVITRLSFSNEDFSKCPTLETKCGFNSLFRGGKSCNGTISAGASGSILVYESGCSIPQADYRCIKKETKDTRKYGSFALMQNSKDQRIFCIHSYYDRKQNLDVILHFNSPQCSDIDWGITSQYEETFYEKLTLYEVCEQTKESPTTIARIGTKNKPASASPFPTGNYELDIKKMVRKKSSGAHSSPSTMIISFQFLVMYTSMVIL